MIKSTHGLKIPASLTYKVKVKPCLRHYLPSPWISEMTGGLPSLSLAVDRISMMQFFEVGVTYTNGTADRTKSFLKLPKCEILDFCVIKIWSL